MHKVDGLSKVLSFKNLIETLVLCRIIHINVLFQKPVLSSKAPTSPLSTSLSWQNAAALTQARRVIRETDGRAGRWYRIVFLGEGNGFG
jgi:hypothetical protein